MALYYNSIYGTQNILQCSFFYNYVCCYLVKYIDCNNFKPDFLSICFQLYCIINKSTYTIISIYFRMQSRNKSSQN